MAVFDLKDQVCVVGVGTSEKFAFALPEKSPISLGIESLRAALEDAGLKREDIDGFQTSHGGPGGKDYDEFAVFTGCEFQWVNQNWNHGRWGATSVAQSALALCAGLCNYVAILNITTRGAHDPRGYGKYFGPEGGSRRELGGGGHGEVDYHGMDTPGAAVSMVARKYFSKYGATEEELGATSVAFRKHANLNPMAIMYNRPMTLEDYLNSRPVTPPFRLFDYCLRNEGATCLILTTAEKAKDLKKKPVYVSGVQGTPAGRDIYAIFSRQGLGISYGGEYDYKPGKKLVYEMAGVTQKDIDAFYTYDSFSTNLWMALEQWGFCPPGEAHLWCQGGRIELGGELPCNTNGGLMSEGHYHGYNQMIEMVRQLRGGCGKRQVRDAEVVQWGPAWGDSVIMTAK